MLIFNLILKVEVIQFCSFNKFFTFFAEISGCFDINPRVFSPSRRFRIPKIFIWILVNSNCSTFKKLEIPIRKIEKKSFGEWLRYWGLLSHCSETGLSLRYKWINMVLYHIHFWTILSALVNGFRAYLTAFSRLRQRKDASVSG